MIYLRGQLSGWGYNYSHDLVRFGAGGGAAEDLDERDHKRQCLPRTGGGVDRHVLVTAKQRDSGGLDRGAELETGPVQSFDDRVRETRCQVGKAGAC